MKVNLTENQIVMIISSLTIELSLGKNEINDYDKKLRILKKLVKAINE